MAFFQWQGQDLYIALHVQPRAHQTAILGIYNDGVQGDRLKIKITAPPVDGQANAEICKCFAKWCGVAKSQVELLKGETGRDKQIRIKSPKTFHADLQKWLEDKSEK